MLERPLPEDTASHGGALERCLARRRQVVDAGGDERLQRVGDATRATVAHSALDQHPDRLLDEERIPLGALEQLCRKSRRQLTGRTCKLDDELVDQQLALLGGQRLELDRGRPDTASAPPRSCVEQLRSRETEYEERRADPVGEVLDEIEQRLLGPVDILKEEDKRLHVAERLHDLPRRPRDLLGASLALERLEHPRREPEHVRDRLLLAARAQLLERLLQRVVVGDAGGGLDHLRQRPVGDSLAVRQAASRQDARALEPVDELPREAALADSRLAEDREQVRAAVANGARERVLEELELGLATDEGSARAERTRRTVERLDDAPGAELPVDALELERAGVLDDERPGGESMRGRTDEDLSRPRDLLEPRGQVHGLTGDERRVGVLDDDLPSLDADPGFQTQLVDRLAHGERGARRALGVVLVRLWNAERREHGVAGELLDDAPVERHALRDHLEKAVDTPPHDLGVGGGDEARRVDEVDEQHCRELPLHTRSVETSPGGPLFRFQTFTHPHPP